ncbi:Pancreatic lipase-related protein 1, partial [Eufriesea mexicana]
YMIDDHGNQVPLDINELLPETLWQTERKLPDRMHFYLYTKENPTDGQQLYIDDVKTLNNSNFDPQKETKIITHGWMNNYLSDSCVTIRDAFLQNSDCNVIVIDWGKIAKKEYYWASNRVLMVGKFAAKMISFLESQGMDENKLTIVGHSLGAHVAGLASNYAARKANYVVARNTFNPLIKGIEKDLEAVDALQEWNNGPDDGNIVKRDLLTIFETLQQTEEDLPNRVFFYLYTRNNKDNPQQLHIDDVETLNNSYFDAQKPTKFVTHGWRSSSDAPACQLILKAFLENSDCNVILIDWSKIADNEYIWTSDRVQIVGQYAAKMVSFLESQGLDANNLTIVGHSLGAHVAGMTSNYATEKANYIVDEQGCGMTMNIPETLTRSETLSCYGMSQTGMHLMLFQKNSGSDNKVLCGSVHPAKRGLPELPPR